MQQHRIRQLCVVLFSLVLVLSGCYENRDRLNDYFSFFDISGSVSHYVDRDQLWLEDINAFADGYKSNHVNLFYWNSEAFFDAQVDELRQEITDLTDSQIVVKLGEIINSMQDLHANIPLWSVSQLQTQVFPMVFRLFYDGLYVINVQSGSVPDYAKYLYMKVISINGMTMEEIEERLFPAIAGERYNEYRRGCFHMFFYPEILYAVGVPYNSGEFLFEFQAENGEIFEQVITPVLSADYTSLVQYPMFYAKNPQENWCIYLEDEAALYIAYNTCSHTNDPVPALFVDLYEESICQGGISPKGETPP